MHIEDVNGQQVLIINGGHYVFGVSQEFYNHKNAADLGDETLFDLMAMLTIAGDYDGARSTIEAYKLKQIEKMLLE